MAKNAYNTLEIGRLSTRQARRLTVAAVSCVSETMQAYVQESSSTGLSKARLASIDAYRGLVMFLMLAEVLRFSAVSDARPGSVFWRFLCDQQTHAAWTGCSLHDLIQPGFFFLVGVVLPFSIARRQSSGQTFSPRPFSFRIQYR